MSISDAAGADLLNLDFNGASYTPPATWYVGFRGSGVELSGNGYARIALTANSTNFPVTSTKTITNGVEFETTVATGGDWGQADEVGLWAASTGGSPRYYDPLDAPFTLLDGRKRTFEAGALSIKLI